MSHSDHAPSTRNLLALNKQQLIQLIMLLEEENINLKKYNDFMMETSLKIEGLERRLNIHEQYNRRESIEIDMGIKQEGLDDKVIEIYAAAEVTLYERLLTKHDIVACNRIGKKGKTIVRFANRKLATSILYQGRKLQDNDTFVNNFFCCGFSFINFQIRAAENKRRFIDIVSRKNKLHTN